MATKKTHFFLDVEGCMWPFNDEDGNHRPYRMALRAADHAWVERETGHTFSQQELHTYREREGAKIGMDRALLKFITDNHKRKIYTIADLAEHRRGKRGYRPDLYLEKNPMLVGCLQRLKRAGKTLVIASDNPAAERTIRALGVGFDTIPPDLVFDPSCFNCFKKDRNFFPQLLQRLGIDASQAAMFGDSDGSDITPARNAGITAVKCVGPSALVAELYGYLK